MVYLLGVVVVATRFGRGPAIMASVLSVAAFDFFYVQPYLTFAVSDTQYLVTFAVMLLVALVISTLTVRLRQQAEAARQRERRTASLYSISQELASTRAVEHMLRAAVRHIHEVFETQVVVLLPNAGGRLQPWGNITGWWGAGMQERMLFAPNTSELGVAQWVYDHSQIAGLGTDTLAGSDGLYLPLGASRGTVGVLGVRPAQPRRFLSPDQLHLLETFANQTAVAIERAQLADEAQQAQVQIETERLRNSLLSSVSHDLRTPLAVITGSASSLLEGESAFDVSTRRELTQTIFDEGNRLNRLVSNLLDMTRLEAGTIQVQKEWQPLEEVVGAALTRLEPRLQGRPVSVSLPADLPLVPLDSVLIEQVLINLLENALKHTPSDSPIDIDAWSADGAVVVEVADHGPGLPPGDEQRVFEKFYHTQAPGRVTGVGLGLTICRGLVEAHGGRIWAENRPEGGARFRFTLPLGGLRAED
jgi:two-component system sensor histidine kinase KdpD